MTVAEPVPPEFSRVLGLGELEPGPVERQLSANAEECAALATRFGIPGVTHLWGVLTVSRPGRGPAIRVAGRIEAEVTQTCVVSLEPIAQQVSEGFVQRYTLEAVPEPEEEVFSDPDAEEPPEPLTGDSLDLGEVLAEQLALALDPYPRAPGATLQQASFGTPHTAEELAAARSPFAALKNLKTPDSSR